MKDIEDPHRGSGKEKMTPKYDVDSTDSEDSDSSDSLVDHNHMPEFPPEIAARLSLDSIDLSAMSKTEIIRLLDSVNTELHRQSFCDPETLRLLQDLSYHFLALPSSFILDHVTFDRKDVIGRGGEATVYHGRLMKGDHLQPIVVREVVMPPKEWKSPLGQRVTQLVHREAITHSQLDHPNILPFLGIYHEELGSPPITVLPLVERGSLHDLLANSSIEFETLKCILVGVTRGVEYLHSRRPTIIHGDLHPGNVLIDHTDNPYLCDFGLSRIRHELTRTRTIVQEAGRFRFLAPELSVGWAKSFRTSPSTDVFSLSMTLLNTWSGLIPLSEVRNDLKVASQFRKGRRPSIPTVGVSLDPELKRLLWDLLSEMWAQDPDSRPSSLDVLTRLSDAFGIQPHNNPQSIRHEAEEGLLSLLQESSSANALLQASVPQAQQVSAQTSPLKQDNDHPIMDSDMDDDAGSTERLGRLDSSITPAPSSQERLPGTSQTVAIHQATLSQSHSTELSSIAQAEVTELPTLRPGERSDASTQALESNAWVSPLPGEANLNESRRNETVPDEELEKVATLALSAIGTSDGVNPHPSTTEDSSKGCEEIDKSADGTKANLVGVHQVQSTSAPQHSMSSEPQQPLPQSDGPKRSRVKRGFYYLPLRTSGWRSAS